jgi:phage gpG-like protein
MADIEFIDNIDDILSQVDKNTTNGMQAIAFEMENNAKQDCPVGTPESTGIPWYVGGNLRNSISTDVTVSDDEKSVTVGSNVEYAPYVELDDSKRHITGKAHFLRDSVAQHVDEYMNKLVSFLK